MYETIRVPPWGIYLIEKASILVLSVHLMKAEILASKCRIMQFSFEYINKTSKLNQQTHSEANGKQGRLYKNRKIYKYFLASSQSVMLSPP